MMAKLSLATNFDHSLLEKVAQLNNHYAAQGNAIIEVFGALPSAFGFNTGRPAINLPPVKFGDMRRHVALAHSYGLGFNYVLNEVCLGGMEHKKEGLNKISGFIECLAEIEVDVVTVSNPFIVRLINNKFPKILINISVICGINSLQKAREWIDLGGRRLTLINATKNLPLIRTLKKYTGAQIELRANSSCQEGSSLCYAHYLEFAHNVNLTSSACLLSLNCQLTMLKDPIGYLLKRGVWVRPEDLNKYSEAGVDIFKVLSRTCTTQELLARAEAYLSGNYQGNLLDLIGKGPFGLFYLDNSKLDGFIDRFMKTECPKECGNCEYCKKVAIRSLRVYDKKKIRKATKKFEAMIDRLFDPRCAAFY